MSDEKSMLRELISSLKQQRDELALQIHLGKAEAKEEWNRLEKRLHALAKQYEPVKDAVEETSSEVLSGLKLVAEEIRAGFQRIRKSL
jgi:uncharacterized coiled-coil DUF342 family protein